MYYVGQVTIQVFNKLIWREIYSSHFYSRPHRAVQPLAAIQTLAKPPFGHNTTCTDRHCTSEMQLVKANHLSVVCFEYDIY